MVYRKSKVAKNIKKTPYLQKDTGHIHVEELIFSKATKITSIFFKKYALKKSFEETSLRYSF